MNTLDCLKRLCQTGGPSGYETHVAAVAAELLAPWMDEVWTDRLGNVIGVRRCGKPNAKRLLLDAHLDQIGLVVTHIEEKGFLRVGAIGGIHPDGVIHTPVHFQNGTCGVIAAQVGSTPGKRTMADLYLDIGAASREEAEQMVQVGDVAVYRTPVFQAGNMLTGPYLDNRISCLVLLAAMERLKESPNDLYFVFSSQEEVGLRGAKLGAHQPGAPPAPAAVESVGIGQDAGLVLAEHMR